jgi:NADPH:quinone reductase-like Zn-dependent oxidoreductase
MKIGWDLSGTVVAIGDSVKEIKVGDEVFGCMPFQYIGEIIVVWISV